MKKYPFVFILFTLLNSCSKEEVQEQETEKNLPPARFKVELLQITHNLAVIKWEEAIDPENEKITYTVFLDNQEKLVDTVPRAFVFTHLDELTNYTSRIIAKDESGNETTEELQFSTKKYYNRFLKAYDYESSEWGSTGMPSHMIETFEGDFVITGTSITKDGGHQSFALKIDKEGNEIWMHFYGNEVNQITNITQARDGGFILVAYNMILKIDGSGNEVWRTIDSNHVAGEKTSVKEDSQGNIFAVGYKNDIVPNPDISHFGLLTKISSTGEILWEKEFRDSYRSTFDDLIIDQDDNLIIFGTVDTDEGNAEKIDFWLLKTDNSGEVIWKRTLFSYGHAFARQIIKTRDNNYVMVGFSWGGYDIGSGAIFKITPDGDEIWSSQISLSSVLSVSETFDGGFISVGHFDSSGHDDLGISRLTSAGTEEWTRRYVQDYTHLRGKAILETEDEGYIFVSSSGKNYYYGNDRPQILVFKTDPEGNYK